MPSAAMMPSRRPPRAALAMTKVMSAPGTIFSARPARAKARNAAKGGRSSAPPTSSTSEVVVHRAVVLDVRRGGCRLDLGWALGVEGAFPARYHARGDRVADDVGRRAAHVEEVVDGEDQQQAGLG